MIIAIANQHGGCAKSVVANSLAMLRARAGRKVLLLDADPRQDATACNGRRGGAGAQLAVRSGAGRNLQEELERLRRHYNDILIDTEGRDTLVSRSALIAARLVLVPVAPDQADLASQYKLIARLNSARMFNPGLRVLFVAYGGAADLTQDELAAIRAYAARVMSATLASIVIHEHCSDDEMDALYKEVFAP
jgi:chromosome partitioning protein